MTHLTKSGCHFAVTWGKLKGNAVRVFVFYIQYREGGGAPNTFPKGPTECRITVKSHLVQQNQGCRDPLLADSSTSLLGSSQCQDYFPFLALLQRELNSDLLFLLIGFNCEVFTKHLLINLFGAGIIFF